jgi:DNA-binding PucR family transcriptional regulator
MIIEKDPFDRSFSSLESLTDTISEVLQCPVTIEDANHRLIAYSSHDPQTDPARIATIVSRRVPEKVINALWQNGVIQKLMESDEPVRIPAINEVGLGVRLAIAIRKNNNVLGYIWAIEIEEKLHDFAFHQLIKAAQAAKTKLLQLRTDERKEERGHQDFFWQLLSGYLKSDAVIKEKAKILGVMLPASYQVVVLQFESEINQKLYQQIQYIITTTQRIRIIFHINQSNQLILLTASQPQQMLNQNTEVLLDLINQMKNRFGSSPTVGGGGAIYDNYSYIEKSYQEALTVLQIKKQFPEETSDIFHYSDLGFFRFLPLILEEKRIHRSENECLKKLKRYDRENNGNLLHTLEIYLSSDSNVNKSADSLHIHANTLTYRLKRIAEISGIDLNNMNQKVTLYLELKTENLDK